MKKLLILLVLSAPTFANVYEYTLDSADTSNCLDKMTVVEKNGEISLTTSNELGAYFNKDSSQDDLLIENINEGRQTIRATNSSHGTKTKTYYTAVKKNDLITVDKVIKYGTFGTEKAEGKLTLDFSGKKLQISIYRSFSETFGGGWEKENYCSYTEVK